MTDTDELDAAEDRVRILIQRLIEAVDLVLVSCSGDGESGPTSGSSNGSPRTSNPSWTTPKCRLGIVRVFPGEPVRGDRAGSPLSPARLAHPLRPLRAHPVPFGPEMAQPLTPQGRLIGEAARDQEVASVQG